MYLLIYVRDSLIYIIMSSTCLHSFLYIYIYIWCSSHLCFCALLWDHVVPCEGGPTWAVVRSGGQAVGWAGCRPVAVRLVGRQIASILLHFHPPAESQERSRC
jgi:hypothetical protein